MRGSFKALATVILTCGICGLLSAEGDAATKHYVVTNDDVSGPNTVTFYVAGGTASAPKLTRLKTIKTGGTGTGGGYFGMVRQVLVGEGKNECAFDADGGSDDVAAILFQPKEVVGNYKGSSGDSGGSPGIGLAVNPNHKYLYAAFGGSRTIATFRMDAGCGLTFVSDISAIGLNGGFPHGMAAKGSMMVIAYGDGSIGSFNISGGTPVSNHDLRN